MTLLTKNSTPAERGRGCSFSEPLASAGDVVANNGSITGTPTFSRADGSNLDGSTDRILYNENPLPTNNVFSMVGWVRCEGTSASSIRGTAFGSATFTVAIKGVVVRVNSGNGDLVISFGDGATSDNTITFVTDIVTTNVDTWYHIALTYNGTNMIGYTNGASVGTVAQAYGDSALETFEIGYQTNLNNTESYWQGDVKGVKVFHRVLTATELLDMYEQDVYHYRNNPIVNLPMDFERYDATNSDTLDISGNGNDAGITNATKLTDRKGYNFDGTGDYLTVTHDSSMNIGTGNYTFSMWVYVTTMVKAQHHTLIVKDNPETATGWIFQVIATGATPGTVNFRRNAGNVYVSTQQIQQGTWNHLVFQRIGTGHYFFLNGILDPTSGINAFDMDNTEDMLIGYRNVAYNGYLTGRVAEFKQWNSALTRTQIQDLYRKELKQVNDK